MFMIEGESITQINPESISPAVVGIRGSERFSWKRALGVGGLMTTGMTLGIIGAAALTESLAGVLPENPLSFFASALPPENYPVKLGLITVPFNLVLSETTILFAFIGMFGGILADKLLRKRH